MPDLRDPPALPRDGPALPLPRPRDPASPLPALPGHLRRDHAAGPLFARDAAATRSWRATLPAP